jgi:tetratricopeptide (TPR) repeat protein
LALRRAAEAVASYDKALALRPDDPSTHYNRGNALMQLGRYEGASASYDSAISLRPDYAEAYSNRGNALMELKRAQEALASFDAAIALKPDYAEAHSNRGNAHGAQAAGRALASYDRRCSSSRAVPRSAQPQQRPAALERAEERCRATIGGRARADSARSPFQSRQR